MARRCAQGTVHGARCSRRRAAASRTFHHRDGAGGPTPAHLPPPGDSRKPAIASGVHTGTGTAHLVISRSRVHRTITEPHHAGSWRADARATSAPRALAAACEHSKQAGGRAGGRAVPTTSLWPNERSLSPRAPVRKNRSVSHAHRVQITHAATGPRLSSLKPSRFRKDTPIHHLSSGISARLPLPPVQTPTLCGVAITNA
ncbi:hypothetical protein BC628DRAFT_1396582 [Trametes gibbosa]|nr:hypothetical protein BC628DRAFT_1396582 [Trametes gibbosa]